MPIDEVATPAINIELKITFRFSWLWLICSAKKNIKAPAYHKNHWPKKKSKLIDQIADKDAKTKSTLNNARALV